MQCFEAKNTLVDSIDGTLSSPQGQELSSHLRSCQLCGSERERIGTLLGLLHQQPRVPMPLDLREDPTGNSLPKLLRQNSPKKIWRSLPIAARLVLEGVTIACVVMLGIHLGPRLRALYEERMDARLQKMIAIEDGDPDSIPLARTQGASDTIHEAQYGEEADDLETPAAGDSVSSDSAIQVGKSEIWRFNIKTDSPALVRAQIIKTLREQKIPDTTPGFGGLEAPGGIQFDLFVPVAAIAPLKTALEKVSGPKAENLPFNETFTWYKNRSRKPIPPGKARIVIWLSQI